MSATFGELNIILGLDFVGNGYGQVESIDKGLPTWNEKNIKNFLYLFSLIAQKLNISDIVDNLTSTDTNRPLSAKQGKTLFDTFANYYDKTEIAFFLSKKSNLPDYLSISGNLDTRSYVANDVVPLSFSGLTVLSRGITVTNNKIQLVPGKHYRITCCCPFIDNSSMVSI